MKLSINGIKEQEAWKKAGIALPGYDVEAASENAKENPVWVHFGIGNIFRVFIGGIADGLLEEGVLDRGITYQSLLLPHLSHIRQALQAPLQHILQMDNP